MFGSLEVESCPFARKVLAARQGDGMLHTGPIHEDVCLYRSSPGPANRAYSTHAVGVGGGFPCQACFHTTGAVKLDILSSPWQGISQAGHQAGLADERSALLREMFRIYDTLPEERQGASLRLRYIWSCPVQSLLFQANGDGV